MTRAYDLGESCKLANTDFLCQAESCTGDVSKIMKYWFGRAGERKNRFQVKPRCNEDCGTTKGKGPGHFGLGEEIMAVARQSARRGRVYESEARSDFRARRAGLGPTSLIHSDDQFRLWFLGNIYPANALSEPRPAHRSLPLSVE